MQLKDRSLFRQQCYIDGAWRDADSGKAFEVDNPADGSVLGTVPAMDVAETRRAIEAADRAFPEWSRRPAKERSALLRRAGTPRRRSGRRDDADVDHFRRRSSGGAADEPVRDDAVRRREL